MKKNDGPHLTSYTREIKERGEGGDRKRNHIVGGKRKEKAIRVNGDNKNQKDRTKVKI